jgi:hypothetical protein
MAGKLAAKQQEYGAVAQLVAHLHGMQGVRGSSPLSSTKKVLLSSRKAGPFLVFQGAAVLLLDQMAGLDVSAGIMNSHICSILSRTSSRPVRTSETI